MPFADYKDHADCVAHNRDKKDPDAYCAEVERRSRGERKFLVRYEVNVWAKDTAEAWSKVRKVALQDIDGRVVIKEDKEGLS